MSDLAYVSSRGERFELDERGGMLSGLALELQRSEWTRTLGSRGLKTAARQAQERDVEVWARDGAMLSALIAAADADVSAGSPGEMVMRGWSQRAYVVASEPTFAARGSASSKLTVALVDGVWTRYREQSFHPRTASAGEWLGFPFGFPFGLGASLPSSEVELDVEARPNVRLVIYGPATSPYVIVGGNRYEVDVSVPDGARVVVDGRSKTIELVDVDGNVTNEFGKGVRKGGQGAGSYVFERLGVGRQTVSWDNSFGFDLGWWEEAGCPPWNERTAPSSS